MNAEKKHYLPLPETAVIAIGELLTAAVVCLVYALLGRFTIRILLGGLLGAFVASGNFVLLSLAVGRATDRIMEQRGDNEMTEEESAAFAAEHQGKLTAAVRLSFFVRSGIMLAVLLLGFFSGFFEPLATLITMLPWRLFLSLGEVLRKKSETPTQNNGN